MPLYEYRCKQCGQLKEVRHGFKEAHAEPCPHCGGEMVRVFNPTGIVFKGSGFYVNDSRKSSGGASEAKSGSGDAAKSADAKPSESKPSEATSSETKSSEPKSSEPKSSEPKSSEPKGDGPKPSGDSGGGGSDKKSSGKGDAAA
jgi:putative FmdB family regulatory protein